jgi:hypothetical protein
MGYNTELLGFWTFFIVWYCREHDVSEMICFRPQVKGEKTPTQLGPLERANLNQSINYLMRLALSKGPK